ncbi:MAG: hypothetical protein NTV94_08795 [Planctomycetota bacterium]|nr:hypothetical protein [Planctomycetota bacterium]
MPTLPSPRRVIPALLLLTLAAAPSLAQSRDSRPSTHWRFGGRARIPAAIGTGWYPQLWPWLP